MRKALPLLIVLMLPPVLAQEIRTIRFLDYSGSLNLSYQAVREWMTSPDAVDLDFSERYLEGGVTLETEGYIYHPNFITFDISGNLTSHRSNLTFFSDQSINNALHNTYDLKFSFLPRKVLTVDVYAQRRFFSTNRIFLERLNSTFTNTGAILYGRTRVLPFRLEVSRRHLLSEGLTYSERDQTSTELDFLTDVINRRTARSQVRVKSRDYYESIFDIRYRSTEMLADYRQFYGAAGQNSWTSYLTWNHMTGDYDFDFLLLNSNLTHYLTDTLSLGASYSGSDNRSLDRSFAQHEGTGRINYELYDSLALTGIVGGRRESSTIQDNTIVFAQGRLGYRKKIPTGRFQMTLVQRLESSDYTSSGGVAQAVERIAFDPTDSVVLIATGIRLESIRLTSLALDRVYIRDIDYQALVVNGLVTIIRLTGGDIPPGATVLIHYDYLAYPDYHLATHYSQHFFSILFLRYFRLFHNRSSTDYDISSDVVITPFEDHHRRITGGQLLTPWVTGEYNFENYDATLTGYTSHNWRVMVGGNVSSLVRASASAARNDVRFDRNDYRTRLDAYNATLTLRPFAQSAQAIYRYIRYRTTDIFRDRQSLLFRLRWQARKLSVEVDYERLLNDTDSFDRRHNNFNFTVRRLF